MTLITELPHANYTKGDISAIDFQIEKMPLSANDKKSLARSFMSGKGIIGKMPLTGKYLLFTPTNIKVLKNKPKDDTLLLPPDWKKYAVILKDSIKKNNTEKSYLKETIRKIVREILIREKTIGRVSRKINITIELDMTKHAGERQFRHDTKIEESEILSVAQRAIEPISRELLADDIRVGEYILIKDSRTKLNLIGVLSDKNDILELKIITVMRKENFKPKAGTKVVEI